MHFNCESLFISDHDVHICTQYCIYTQTQAGKCLCLVSFSGVICLSLSPRFGFKSFQSSSVKQPSVALCYMSSGYVPGLGPVNGSFAVGVVFFVSGVCIFVASSVLRGWGWFGEVWGLCRLCVSLQ